MCVCLPSCHTKETDARRNAHAPKAPGPPLRKHAEGEEFSIPNHYESYGDKNVIEWLYDIVTCFIMLLAFLQGHEVV